MSRSQEITKQLQNQVLNLIDDLLIVCPNEMDILVVRLFFENQMLPEELMKGFIKWVYPWEQYIRNRDEQYFEKNEYIFGPLPTDKVAHFKRRLQDGTFTPEDKTVIWDYFQVFLDLMNEYNKVK
jgi:hypothetical protein